MDETYIKMSDCEEIQAQRPIGLFLEAIGRDKVPWGRGAWQITIAQGEWFASYPLIMFRREKSKIEKVVWLPTQDRLQGMVHPEVTDWVKAVMLTDFLRGEGYHSVEDSMGQLWLAYIMKVRYDKVWDNGEWKEG